MIALLFVATLCVAVTFGTDVFFTLVGRSALARTSERAMAETMGRLHEVADRRMPLFGVTGILCSAALVVLRTREIAPWAALLAQVAFLAVYLRVAKPVNTALTRAAQSGEPMADARAAQARWDSVLVPRCALLLIAMCALLTAIAAIHA